MPIRGQERQAPESCSAHEVPDGIAGAGGASGPGAPAIRSAIRSMGTPEDIPVAGIRVDINAESMPTPLASPASPAHGTLLS
ncbi:hypothetical protein GCM10011612_00440 [Actinomyces gaoshouyii]|uniref:Uncharacterized protein n=1 Tax=Actinomyces gaoshouyii TaxID=1960083 RepID=A0A8H9LHV3_9ACTO|nr:hypothetical protein GCM10011612_00440 [Actinomyces gaoshouyii]